MIAHLSGTIISLQAKSAIVDVNGVGYEIHLTEKTRNGLTVGKNCALFIHTAVREDAIALYGFEHDSELRFFRQLISVSRIGPKSAMEILNCGAAQVQKAILEKNTAFISKIPGVGKKTSERIVLELENKIVPSAETENEILPSEISDEIVDAIMRLGFQRHHVKNVLRSLPVDIVSEQDIIKFFLKSV